MKDERRNDGLHVTRMEQVSGRSQVRLSSDSHSKLETCVKRRKL